MMNDLSGIGKLYRIKLSKVLEQNPRIVDVALVKRILEVSPQEAGRLLARWSDRGWVKRIKRGIYVPIPLDSTTSKIVVEEPFLIADKIYSPGYIAGFSAIKYWDFTEQIIESVTYFTTNKVKNRTPNHGGIKFKLKTISKYKLFGLKTIWIGSNKIYISDPTKTVIDLLDDPKIVGGMTIIADFFLEYINSKYYDFELLVQYALKNKNNTVFKRLGLLYDTKFTESDDNILQLLKNISKSYSEFDPTVSSKFYLSKWKLKVSSYWKKEYGRKK